MAVPNSTGTRIAVRYGARVAFRNRASVPGRDSVEGKEFELVDGSFAIVMSPKLKDGRTGIDS